MDGAFQLFVCLPLHFGSITNESQQKPRLTHSSIHWIVLSIYRFRFLVLCPWRKKHILFLSYYFHFHGSMCRRKKFISNNRVTRIKKKNHSVFSTTTRTHISLLHRRLRRPINRSYFRAECKGQIYNRNRFPIYREKLTWDRWKVVAMCGLCINHQSYQLHQGEARRGTKRLSEWKGKKHTNCHVIPTYWFSVRFVSRIQVSIDGIEHRSAQHRQQ